MDNNTIYKEFEKAYNDLSEPIFRHCYFRIYNRERAAEITQDVFMRTWDYLRDGKKEVQNLRAFIYKVAHNLIVNEITRRKQPLSLDEIHEEHGFDPGGDNEEEVMRNRLDGEQALKRLKDLDPNYRDVLYMRYVDELTVKEIAELRGEKENNVSVKIHRGLEKMKQMYRKENKQ